jgi:sugar phosphate isomerase/epimerase
MTTQTRRTFIKNSAALAITSTLTGSSLPGLAAKPKARKYTLQLDTGSIGINADQRELLNMARQHGFESISAYPQFLAELSSNELKSFLSEMKDKGIVWGTSGLPFNFRNDEASYKEGIAQLPRQAQALQKAGVTRMGTWISPSHNERTYLENFKLHVNRLREITKIAGDHGLRFGLEYVGPKTSRISNKYVFIYSMKETKELIAEIGNDNVGFILDTTTGTMPVKAKQTS